MVVPTLQAINDYFIYVPNGIGAFLGVVQAVLIFLFPRISYRCASKPSPGTAVRHVATLGR